jgi:acyl carrier protein
MPELSAREPIDTREAFESALIDFVSGPLFARHGARPAAVDRSTLLFEAGIVDSLGIIDLVAFVERATGRPVPVRMVDLRFFGSVERIARAFWAAKEQS